MCASVYSSLLLFTLTTISTIFDTRMATEGLPLVRQERGADDRGLLAGADFLSVFMSSSLRQAYLETTTTTTPDPTTIPTTWQSDSSYTRATRSTSLLTSPPLAQTNTEDSSFYDTTLSAQLRKLEPSSDSSLNDGVVVAVSVSSSVGRTLINKEGTTTTIPDQNLVASEEHPSLVAEANKSEFSVEESEPITTNSEAARDFVQGYPASVQPLPRHFNPPSDKLHHPIHQTVIYHNNPRDPNRARSVSYSTVIQSVPHPETEKDWGDGDKHDRHERHFESSFGNNLHSEKAKFNESKWQDSGESPGFTTERNWEIREKPYTPPRLPTVYGKPEQNYEVDESASVMTNGRIHGIQPSPTLPSKEEVSKKIDDNQKVGYVVEGRNYRKYRVEERTSDGFIVGEYGVVSHDDGSLRGVRYTADGTISPRLIYDALMKFLSL
ncbi:uncharacterized protein LOC103315212 [Tribolium castaneum]|uniref:Uncharacterized protein n=2 Tax=Tribolium castaneum TaxID=7070 RepID=D6WA90_TRICA|nr:PREDICTED: uncharacterized protein LOC103315212 [Tribolium castaneum]EEZ98038.2 hypothetical protein TcasGA2_TC000440 [Tribolium castaneum]|eukprot:XP_008201541.1 PREDICTED: uncharacterized protein LOC103315212 [Tribolium castaneum]